MNALQELNELRKAAKAAGIAGYNKMKLVDLRALNLTITETPKVKEEDPFDEIDPEVEGDHLEDTTITGQAKEVKVTREAWLLSAVDALKPMFRVEGAKLPHVAVSVGFPSKNVRKRIGECWHGADNEHPQIFISPVLDNATQVLSTLVHELVHACLGPGVGHGKEFGTLARSLGLTGKMTATVPDATLVAMLEDITTEIGDYPHVKLTLNANAKKQSTRMLKVACNNLECGFIVRTTAKWIATFEGCEWLCPCGGTMVPEVKEEETGEGE